MGSHNHKYSIIIPHRNRFALLVQLLSTIPKRKDIEILVIDDASDGSTKEKLLILEAETPQLTILYNHDKDPKGAGWGRNQGIFHASGKYLIFADSDDFFSQEAFTEFDAVTRNKYDFVVFKTRSITAKGQKSGRTNFLNFLIEEAANIQENEPVSTKKILTKIDAPWAKLISKSLIVDHNIEFEEIHYSNDVLFNLQVLIHAKHINVSRSIVYVVLDHDSSLIKERNEDMLDQRFDACIRFNNVLATQEFSKNAHSITAGYILNAKEYSWLKMLSFIRKTAKSKAKLMYPLHRYFIAFIMKLVGADPLKIRFYVVFGEKV
ncbi:glycosyltransferase family 2 protein [Gracilimonas tropica]|uniref:glycosyltransferase family 2 protein n=1 Tax=Gracilimonas tropica TaxID=454600 RepID=UPI0003A29F17|nr:glycosyltransferase family 2 protein [Gracilimonas tropica]